MMFGKRHSFAVSRIVSVVIIVVIVVAVVAGAGYFLLSSTGTSASSTSTANTSSLTDFKFGFNGPPDVTDTPGFMLWQAAGQQVGLNIIPSYWGGNGQLLVQALTSGTIDASEIGADFVQEANLGTGNSSGSYPFVMFGTYEATVDDAIVVKNSIHTWADMAGQPLAVNSGSSGTPFFCKYLETLHGLSPSQQDCAVFGGETARAGALLNGKATGAILEPFNTVNALLTGKFHILDTVPNALPQFLSESLFTTRTFMNAHSNLIVKLEEAELIAARMAHNETTFLKYEEQSFPGSNETIVGTAWKIWMGLRFWDPYGNSLTLASIDSLEKLYISNGRLTTYIPPAEEVNASVEPAAVAAIGNYSGPVSGYADPSIHTLNVTIPGLSSIIDGGSGFNGVLSLGSSGFGLQYAATPVQNAYLGRTHY